MKILSEDLKTELPELPEGFDPTSYSEIPYSTMKMFEGGNPEMEKLGREAIRKSLEESLGKPVVSRETIGTRYGLRNAGFSVEDLMMNRVKVR